jgi:hypothetical protein
MLEWLLNLIYDEEFSPVPEIKNFDVSRVHASVMAELSRLDFC